MITPCSIIIGTIFFILSVDSSVNFLENIPELAYQNIPYEIIIRSKNSNEKFPFQDFVLSFELRNRANDEIFGIVAVTKPDFKPVRSRGFSIVNFAMNQESITVMITFALQAHNQKFIVRFSTEKTEDQKQAFFDNNDRGERLEKTIRMYLPTIIKLEYMPEMGVINAADKEEFGQHLIPDKYGFMTCKASNGLHDITPEFVNSNILGSPDINVIKVGMISLQWKVSLADHAKVIQCKLGERMENITLTVYHYLSEVLTSPPIDKKISQNSQVKCISKNGYPIPKMSWVFLTGPPESWKFYQLRNNNVTLFINSTAPVNSNWTFECRGSNEVSPVVQKYLSGPPPHFPIKKVYNFTIVEADGTVLKSQTGTVVAVVIVVILLFAIIVLIVTKGTKIRSFLMNRYTRAFKSEAEHEKSMVVADRVTKYSEEYRGGTNQNGTDETAYAVIIGTVQTKGGCDTSLGPIDRV